MLTCVFGCPHTAPDFSVLNPLSSLQTMTADIVAIWQAMFGSSSSRVPTLLVGHSMGGALAVWAAASKQIIGLEGVVVIDVVEGTALGRLAKASWARKWGLCCLP